MAAGALGDAIRARLEELGLPARRFAAAGYVSNATLFRILAGQENLRDPSRVAELERGLGWRPGAVNELRGGATPVTIPIADWPRTDGDWRAAVEQAWRSEASGEPGSVPTPDRVDPRQVARLVDFLFTTVHPADGPEESYEQVAARVSAAGGELSAADLEALRAGKRRQLDRVDARALAGAFSVPTSYFFDPVDADRVRQQLSAVVALRDRGVERIARRSAGLSAGSLKQVEDMIEHLRSLEADR